MELLPSQDRHEDIKKMVRVESKQKTIKRILSRLLLEYPEAGDLLLINFSVYLANFMAGNQVREHLK